MKNIPKDLGIKLGSPEEAAWTTICEAIEREIDQGKRALEMNECLLPFVKEKIVQAKMK